MEQKTPWTAAINNRCVLQELKSQMAVSCSPVLMVNSLHFLTCPQCGTGANRLKPSCWNGAPPIWKVRQFRCPFTGHYAFKVTLRWTLRVVVEYREKVRLILKLRKGKPSRTS